MPAQNIKTQKLPKEETGKKHEEKSPPIRDVLVPEGTPPMTDLQRAVADPRTARSPEILALQRKYGNDAVQRLLVNHNLQAKLTVGAANDSYEQEADRVAARVMSAPAPSIQRQAEEEEELQAKPLAASITPLIQRQPLAEEEEEPLQGKFIQRQSLEEEEEEPLQGKFIPGRETFTPGTDFESRLAATRGGGRPLPKTTRDFMEQRFGADFSGVRLHTGSESAQLNREVSAQAFTRGQDVYLGEGKEHVESGAGKQLLAHELAHVIQQSGSGGEKRGGEPLQREAENELSKNTTVASRIGIPPKLQTTASVLQRKSWGNAPAKFRTEHGITGIPESEYLISPHSYKRFAPINEIRAPGQVFHEGPRSFAYLNSEGDADIAAKAVKAEGASDTITLTTKSGATIEASRIPANGKPVWDADVSDDDKVGERHVGHPVKNLGQPLPTLEDPQKIQEARYKQHAVGKKQESGKILSDDKLLEILGKKWDELGEQEAYQWMMQSKDAKPIRDAIREAQKEGKTKLEIVEELAAMYGWSGGTVTKMVNDEELDERARKRIEREHEPTPSYIS